MRVFAAIGSSLIERWDLDRAQLAALSRVQRRYGLGGAASAAAAGQSASLSRWLAVSYYLKFILYAALGLLGVAGVLFSSFFVGLAFSYTLIMLMSGLTFINYFTAVLLDTSDNRILLHLPVSGRTLLAARILCVVKYAGLLALSISLPTAIALAVRFGAVALLVFVISLVLMLIFLVAVTLAGCLFALRHVNPARIRQGILYFQTALFILAMYAGSTVLAAGVPIEELVSEVSGEAWWYFYPPGWMAGLLDYSLMERTRFNGILAATAVLAPLAGFVGCILLFAGGRFTALLSRLEVVPRSNALTSRSFPRWLARLSQQVCVLMNADRQQRAVFGLTSRLMKSDQALKLRTYPFIGTLLVNTGLIVAKFGDRSIEDLPLVVCYYMPLFLALMAPLIQYGADWRAGWCYQVLPFAKPGVIVSGAMKAYLWKYIVPIYVVLLIVSGIFWGVAAALDALFAGAVATLICIYMFWSAASAPPYSKELVPNVTRKDGGLSRLAFIPLACGLIAMHVLLEAVAGDWGVVGGIVVMGGAITAAFRRLPITGSKDVEAIDRHVVWHRSGH